MHRDTRTRTSGTALPLLASLLLAGALWLGASGLGARARSLQETWPRGEELVWLPPPQAAPILAMGYRQLWADVTWARVLVYFGTNAREDVNYRFRYLTRFLDNILALDPKFRRVYEWASYAVTYQGGTVEPEEYELSVRYLERAMKVYPDHWRYFWLAGIRYYMDLESSDPAEQRRLRERGAALIEAAMLKPDAPTNIAELAAGLRTKLGQQERALENLRAVIMSTEDPEKQARLIATYKQMAGKAFPDEAAQAKAELQQRWIEELPFTPAHMYILLGDRPAPTVDIETLLAETDVLGTLLEEPEAAEEATDAEPEAAEEADAAAAPGTAEKPADAAAAPGDATAPGTAEKPADAAGAPGDATAPGTAVQKPAQRGAAATPGAQQSPAPPARPAP
jgi:hypothetical protein